jgi:hypothetical protein
VWFCIGILRDIIDRNFLCRMMVCTRTSEAATYLAGHQRPHRAPLQKAQDPESEPEVVMEDVESDDAVRDRPVLSEPISEASTGTNEEDAELVYYHTRFQRDKVRCRYFCYYHGCKIIIERRACNTPIKPTLFIRQNIFHRSNQQRFSIKVFNET